MRSATEAAEAYRATDLRLRLLLLGDGADNAPLVKGEIPRQRVANGLRQLREAFEAVVESERAARLEMASAASEVEQELRRAASARARSSQRETPAFLTPAQAAKALDMSPSAVYRAIKKGDIQAKRLRGVRGRILIPASELARRRGR